MSCYGILIPITPFTTCTKAMHNLIHLYADVFKWLLSISGHRQLEDNLKMTPFEVVAHHEMSSLGLQEHALLAEIIVVPK